MRYVFYDSRWLKQEPEKRQCVVQTLGFNAQERAKVFRQAADALERQQWVSSDQNPPPLDMPVLGKWSDKQIEGVIRITGGWCYLTDGDAPDIGPALWMPIP